MIASQNVCRMFGMLNHYPEPFADSSHNNPNHSQDEPLTKVETSLRVLDDQSTKPYVRWL